MKCSTYTIWALDFYFYRQLSNNSRENRLYKIFFIIKLQSSFTTLSSCIRPCRQASRSLPHPPAPVGNLNYFQNQAPNNNGRTYTKTTHQLRTKVVSWVTRDSVTLMEVGADFVF